MKYVIVTTIIVIFVGFMAVKAVKSAASFLDDSFRWGGKDGYK